MASTIALQNEIEMSNVENNHAAPVNDTPPKAPPFRRPEIEDAKKFNAVREDAAHFTDHTHVEVFASPPLSPGRLSELGVVAGEDHHPLDFIHSPDHIPSLLDPGQDSGLRTQIYFLDFESRPQTSPARPSTCALAQAEVAEQQQAPPRLNITKKAFGRFVEEFEIPMTFVAGIFQEVIWDGSGCFVRKGIDGETVERIGIHFTSQPWERCSLLPDTFFRAEWGDEKFPQVAIMADFVAGIVTYLIIEASDGVKERVKEGGVADRPLAIAASVLDECLNKWKEMINERRKELLSYASRS